MPWRRNHECAAPPGPGAGAKAAWCGPGLGSGTSRPRARPAPRSGGLRVEPHNIPNLFDEEGVRRQLEGFGAVRVQREGAPDAADRGVAQTGTPGHGPGAPVGGVLGSGLQGQRNHPLHVGIINHTGAAAALLVQQAVQPLLQEPETPFAHRVNTYPQLDGHRSVAPAIGTGQNDSGSQGQRLGRFGPAGPLLQGFPFGAIQVSRAGLVCPCLYSSSLLPSSREDIP